MNPDKSIVNEDLSLYGLFSLFLKNWLTLCISGFSLAIIALVWSLFQPNIYTAKTLLMPVEEDASKLDGMAGNLGGLASLAGLSLGDKGNTNSKLAIELLKSRDFITKFIDKYDLIVPIMAAKSWDLPSNKLVIDEKIYDQKNSKWIRNAIAPRKPTPSLLETYDKFMSILDVEQEPKTKFITVSIEYYSPHIAAEWTRNLVNMLNEEIRKIDKQEADDSINYLKRLANESNISDLRKVFTKLMEEQLKSKMLAEIRKDYVFKIVDPAVAPELKSAPKRAIIVVIAGFLGGIIGIIIVLFRSGRQSYLISKNS
jgi:uncharacterized protein involved in exopolysaccharide biosynthesis